MTTHRTMNTTTPNDGGPAFPVPYGQIMSGNYGLTMRDWFAGMALEALIERDSDDSAYAPDMVKARPLLAYEYADAMLAARNNPNTTAQ